MTFFHHSMTDQELTRAADSMENPFTRVLSDRLVRRADQLQRIARLADISPDLPPTGDDCLDRLEWVATIAREE